MKKFEIDLLMLSETKKRQSLCAKQLLRGRSKSISEDIEIVLSDSRENSRIVNGYLPGETANVLFGQAANAIIDQVIELIRQDGRAHSCLKEKQ